MSQTGLLMTCTGNEIEQRRQAQSKGDTIEMEARASFESRSSARALVVLMVAIVAALLVGGTGGYMFRVATDAAPIDNSTHAPRPFVVEPVPYSSPAASPAAQPTRDPKGFEVPI
jgi:cell division protein FtsN